MVRNEFQFSSPGADVSDAISQFLADREAKQRQAQKDALDAANVQSEIAARNENSRSQAELRRQQGEDHAVQMAINVRNAIARGDQLTPDQKDYLDKGHMGNAYTTVPGSSTLASKAIFGVAGPAAAAADAAPGAMAPGAMAPALDITNTQDQPATQTPTTYVAKATPADLQRDAANQARKDAADAAAQARLQAQHDKDEAAAQRAKDAADARAQIAAEANNTRMLVAGMGITARQQADQEKRDAKAAADKQQRDVQHQAIADAAGQTMNAIDQLVQTDPKTGVQTLAPGVNWMLGSTHVPGAMIASTGMVPSMSKAKAAMDQLTARLEVDLLGQMKAQSKTGATGFGQLSEAEGKILRDSASRLQTAQSPADYLAELQRIRRLAYKASLPPIDASTAAADSGLPKVKIDFQSDK